MTKAKSIKEGFRLTQSLFISDSACAVFTIPNHGKVVMVAGGRGDRYINGDEYEIVQLFDISSGTEWKSGN